MFFLRTGHFFGQTNRKIHLNGITLNDKEFTPEHIDWHCHENAFFTFILQGKIIEANKGRAIIVHRAVCYFIAGKSRITTSNPTAL